MYKTPLLIVCVLLSNLLYAQVGIGTNSPDNSAQLHVQSTSKGLLIPKMTMAERDLIATPATGLLIFQTDSSPGFYYYNGSAWTTFGNDLDWTIDGNNIYNTNTDNVGIGTNAPSALLHVEDTSGSSIGAFSDGFEDNTMVPFTSSDWSITSTAGNYNSGSFGAQSGGFNITNALSSMSLTVTIPTGGSAFSFAYKVSTESSYDFLQFYIDGVLQNSWSGIVNWTTYNGTLTAGNHTLTWTYDKDGSVNSNDDRVYIDDVSIASIEIPNPVLRLVDGNQADNYVLVSDANGNATWTDPTTIVGSSHWTLNNNDIYNSNSGNVGVGVTTPNNKLHVEAATQNIATIYAENLATTGITSHGLHGVANSVNTIGSAGVFGESITIGDHEIGVKGDYAIWGAAIAGIGWATDESDMPTTGSPGGETNDMGVYGGVDYDTGIGVYALNKDLTATGYGAYVDGNFAVVTGTKSGSVPTTKGNQLVYSMESPEIWFEDFGQSKLVNGQAHIYLDETFKETVFIDNEHPMHVFLQEQGDCNGLYFIPDESGNGFTVKEKQNGTSNITFSYRITAKRRFFQDHRFGVDQLQPFENNLAKEKYRKPRTRDLVKMQEQLKRSADKKNAQKNAQTSREGKTSKIETDK